MNAAILFLTCAVAASTAAEPQPAPPFPHPAITEVLFNVPKLNADANHDGARDATSDEFVELINPHDKPINLLGYRIASRLIWANPTGKQGVTFTFPDFTLAPGEIVVIFNGHNAAIPGDVGDANAAPASTNESFAGAWVFTMNMPSQNRAFANGGDFVLLLTPQGQPVDGVVWGNPSVTPPRGNFRLAEVDANPKGSVQRTAADADLDAHATINGSTCSPGEIPAAK
ncbi:MAG: lamin tail domain-containing protein [Phycisphaerales bacterium]|nr:lamin tail domain-containing protein [Phycisphaerales bacterium]